MNLLGLTPVLVFGRKTNWRLENYNEDTEGSRNVGSFDFQPPDVVRGPRGFYRIFQFVFVSHVPPCNTRTTRLIA
jgi:hypothetical protein